MQVLRKHLSEKYTVGRKTKPANSDPLRMTPQQPEARKYARPRKFSTDHGPKLPSRHMASSSRTSESSARYSAVSTSSTTEAASCSTLMGLPDGMPCLTLPPPTPPCPHPGRGRASTLWRWQAQEVPPPSPHGGVPVTLKLWKALFPLLSVLSHFCWSWEDWNLDLDDVSDWALRLSL
jgi:hypothetical protein